MFRGLLLLWGMCLSTPPRCGRMWHSWQRGEPKDEAAGGGRARVWRHVFGWPAWDRRVWRQQDSPACQNQNDTNGRTSRARVQHSAPLKRAPWPAVSSTSTESRCVTVTSAFSRPDNLSGRLALTLQHHQFVELSSPHALSASAEWSILVRALSRHV